MNKSISLNNKKKAKALQLILVFYILKRMNLLLFSNY